MAYELTKGDNWKCTLKLTVEAERVDQKYSESLRQAAKLVSLPGFRPGRVPLQIVEKRLRKQIVEETVMHIQAEAFEEATKEEKLRVLGRPNFTQEAEYEPGKPYVFTAEFEIEPTFELPEYKGISLTRRPIIAKPDEIEAELDSLRLRSAQWVETPDHKAERRDAIYADITVHSEGLEIHKLENERIVMSGPVLADFEFTSGKALDLLMGVAAGDTKEFIGKLKKTLSDQAQEGADVTVMLKINRVDKLILPEADEFAKQNGLESAEQLRSLLEQRIIEYKGNREEQRFRSSVLAAVTANLNFPMPQDLLAKQAESNFKRSLLQLKRMGYDLDQLRDSPHADKIRENSLSDAEKSLKEFFVVERISQEEKIFVTESEVAREIESIAYENRTSAQAVRASLEKADSLDQLRWDLLERKVVDFIIAKANVVEAEEAEGSESAEHEHEHGENCDCGHNHGENS